MRAMADIWLIYICIYLYTFVAFDINRLVKTNQEPHFIIIS